MLRSEMNINFGNEKKKRINLPKTDASYHC